MRRLTSTPAYRPAKLPGSRKGVLRGKVLSLGMLHCSIFLTFDFPLSLAPSCPVSYRTREQRSLTATLQRSSQVSRGQDRAPCSTAALQSLPRPSSVCGSRTQDKKHTLRMQARQKSCYHHVYGKGDAAGSGTSSMPGHRLSETPAPSVPEKADTMYSTSGHTVARIRTPQHPPELANGLPVPLRFTCWDLPRCRRAPTPAGKPRGTDFA